MTRSFDPMEWLLIDSSDRSRLRVARIPESGEIVEQFSAAGSRSSILLELDPVIRPSELAGLAGIAVVYGPGSFSAIRGGVLIANLLSRLYHIPLYGFSKDEGENLTNLRRRLFSGSEQPSGYVSPVYDAEPNITIK